jgi:hypothetical protein
LKSALHNPLLPQSSFTRFTRLPQASLLLSFFPVPCLSRNSLGRLITPLLHRSSVFNLAKLQSPKKEKEKEKERKISVEEEEEEREKEKK